MKSAQDKKDHCQPEQGGKPVLVEPAIIISSHDRVVHGGDHMRPAQVSNHPVGGGIVIKN